ncbi:MAG: cyclic nucleotide-binding domain-containing protein [Magnetospiraceae bacterium]
MVQITSIETTVREHPFFDGMDLETTTLIAGCAKHEVYHAGEFLYREGQVMEAFHLIRHGTVALEVHAPGRDPLIMETVETGDIVGWSWLVPPYRSQVDARAVGLVRTLTFDATCLRGKCDAEPTVGYQFLKRFLPVVAARFAAARLQMLDLYGDDKRTRGMG